MHEIERRQTRGAVELRAATDAPRRVGGYAAKFNRLSQNLGGFVERIDPGFFNKSAGDGWPNVMARYNHDDLLATTGAGSLRLMLDSTGLDYEADLLTDAVSERVFQLVTRGDVHQSSFAFYTYEDEWAMTDQGFPLRTLISGALVDVAPVDSPAYLDTSTGLRSLAEARDMDIDEVTALARANELAKVLSTPATIIDLGSLGERSTKDSDDDGQDESHPDLSRLAALRRDHEMKKHAV